MHHRHGGRYLDVSLSLMRPMLCRQAVLFHVFARACVHTNSIAIPRWAKGRIRASAADLTCGREQVRGVIVVARRI